MGNPKFYDYVSKAVANCNENKKRVMEFDGLKLRFKGIEFVTNNKETFEKIEKIREIISENNDDPINDDKKHKLSYKSVTMAILEKNIHSIINNELQLKGNISLSDNTVIYHCLITATIANRALKEKLVFPFCRPVLIDGFPRNSEEASNMVDRIIDVELSGLCKALLSSSSTTNVGRSLQQKGTTCSVEVTLIHAKKVKVIYV